MMRLPPLLVGRRRGLFASLLVNGVAQGVLAVSTAWLVMQIFDYLGSSQQGVVWLFMGLVTAVFVTAMLRRSERIAAERLGQHFAGSVRGRLYRRLLSSNAREFKRRRKGAVLLKFVGDLSALRRWVSLGLARLVVAGTAVAIALGALFWLHWPFAIGVVMILTLSAMWILWQAEGLRDAIAETRRRHAHLASNVTEKLGNLQTVQAFGQAHRERRLLRRQSDRLIEASVTKAGRIGSLRAVIDATAGGCVVTVLALAYLTPPAGLTPGMVAAVISIIGFLTPPLRELGRAQEYWLTARVARANLLTVAGASERLRERRQGSPLQVDRGAVRLRNVRVRGVMAGISGEVPGGTRVALTGANGSGKSTLLGLIGRLFDPDRGAVFIDGQNIRRVQLASLRRQVAFVSADVPLIGGSLRKNLCYGAGRVTEERLEKVLRECELNVVVGRLSGGLDARVAGGGSSLSQGERLRVGLARALLQEPRVLLLDEPDAHLDLQAVRALHRTIRAFAGTVILATHRKSTLERCDVRWHLQDGQLHQSRLRPPPVGGGAIMDALESPAWCRDRSVAGAR